MIHPKLTLPEGSSQVFRSSGRIFEDWDTLLTDARDTYKAYPGAEARMIDDPPRSRTGIEICLDDHGTGLLYWWEMWISIDDLKKHPHWERMKSGQGRMQVIREQVVEFKP